MHFQRRFTAALILLISTATSTWAQPPTGDRTKQFQQFPVHAALDADGDGRLSPEELAKAPELLATLDSNGDGKLSGSELRPRDGGNDTFVPAPKPAERPSKLSTGDNPPNVVFVMVDDLGWNDVGYHGSEINTPTIDRLASAGVKLENYYAFPACSPTRAAIMSGRSPMRFGIVGPIIDSGALPLTEVTLGDILAAAGYQTSYVGKWHLGHEHRDYFPNNRGWSHAYGGLTGAVDHYSHNSVVVSGAPDWHRNGEPLDEEGHTTDLLTDEAVKLLKNHKGENPFFLYLAYSAPHTPLQAPDKYLKQYESIENLPRRTYAAMVTHLDDALAQVTTTLDELGLDDNTVVIWCSDNGGQVRAGADNTPLPGGKRTIAEGGMRVPAFVHWPAQLKPATNRQFISAVDWLPTLLTATGIKYTPKTDGFDMWSSMFGKNVKRGEFVSTSMGSLAVYLDGWKYVASQAGGGRRGPPGGTGGRFRGAGGRGGRPGTGGSGGRPGLFNLRQDELETNDLTSSHPERVAQMQKILERYRFSQAGGMMAGGLSLRDGSFMQMISALDTMPNSRGLHIIDRAVK